MALCLTQSEGDYFVIQASNGDVLRIDLLDVRSNKVKIGFMDNGHKFRIFRRKMWEEEQANRRAQAKPRDEKPAEAPRSASVDDRQERCEPSPPRQPGPETSS